MRLLITGANGFTGRHLSSFAKKRDYEVVRLQSNITDEIAVSDEVKLINPDYVIHLAGHSHVINSNEKDFYSTNLFGTLNLVKALKINQKRIKKIIIASSANVYGNGEGMLLSEEDIPRPVNHYAMSKLSMEYMVANYFNCLPITIVRPFNYTGAGQSIHFVISKIVNAYKLGLEEIELGNIEVEREYNDVRTFSEAYLDLLDLGLNGTIYNLCSGKSYSLKNVIAMMEDLTKRNMAIKINPNLLRDNEVYKLCGSPKKIETVLGALKYISLENTLNWMLSS
jgi:nucleoside-diphosphate-sugar epimerase